MLSRSERIAAITYAAALAAAVLFVGAIIAAPLLEATRDSGDRDLGSLIHLAYSRICHQLPNRSFQIEGHPFAVCSRCTGIYAGYVLGLVAYPFVRSIVRTETPARIWLLVAIAPAAIDFAGGFAGLFDNTLLSRALTGGVAGAAGAFYTLPGFVCLAATNLRRLTGDRQGINQDAS
jgi:uncharacterized membrane protein